MIDRTSMKPLYRQVEAYLWEEIQRGRWPPGDAVPSPRTLADELSVNYLTVRRAYVRLIEAGVLVGLQGRGTYVSEGATRRRLLFISGLDLSSDDVSSVFRSICTTARRHAERRGYTLDQVFLPRESPELARTYGDEDFLSRYDGVLFSACSAEHWYVQLIRDQRKPCVILGGVSHDHIGYENDHLWTLGLSQFDVAKGSAINVISYSSMEERVRAVAEELGVGIEYFPIPLHLHSMSAVERWGYYCASHALARGRGSGHWFISDDVAARGASRAILTGERSALRNHHLVVQCDTNQIVPLGVRTTYILISVRQTARQGIQALLGRIDGTPTPREALRPHVVSDQNNHIQRLLGVGSHGAWPWQAAPA